MPDQPTHQPRHQSSHQSSQSISEIVESLQNSWRESVCVDRKVEAAVDTSREMLARSTELLARADAALRRR